ncbi:glycolipid 2-alpha-mannosyltransferase-domain-containing protein [Coemansia spiralis]|nr:glycolipid 2-alpha-mannosyltransferase-domain-containing protein [Coemansia spiralis]
MLNIKWRLVAIIASIVLLVHFLWLSPYLESQQPSQDGNLLDDTNAPNHENNDNDTGKGAGIIHPPAVTVTVTRETAFVILTRNKELDSLRETLAQLESRFNHRYHYPYVFLNNEPFSDKFKEKIADIVSGECHFGLIPTEHWSYPDYINQTRASEARKDMAERKIIYGGSESYRHMCRYESGFFFRHPLMDKFKWYWRVEPGVKFACDIDYDPFLFMEKNNKKYGFTISIKEYILTIPTLWDTTVDFMKEHKDMIPEKNLMEFVTDDKGGYNRCHFWSNFEIGSLDFLRSEKYLAYFDHLDRAGGFFYERWGDAPVHSLGVAMFLNKNDVHWFEDIGYYHGPLWNCPKGELNKNKKCWCPEEESIEIKNKAWSCTLDFVALSNP